MPQAARSYRTATRVAMRAAVVLALTASAALGQAGPRGDSAAAVRAARVAQAAFERERTRLLPRIPGDPGRCIESVGRMCVVDGSGRDWWPAPEAPAAARARADLLRALAEAQGRARGDGWILGQQVFYLGEEGRWAAADSLAAEACAVRVDPWCLALRGLALHEAGRFVEAEGVFRSALERMGPDSVRAWSDPAPLLDPGGRNWLEAVPAAARAGAVAWIWALADPLLLIPGNDQRTEQWARRTLARVRADARGPHAVGWGGDLEELLIRYGREVGWERAENGSLESARADEVIGYEDPDSRPLMPPGAVLADVLAPPAAWLPDARRPRSWYAPAYAAAILPAEAQLAVFPRGDRAMVVGGVGLPPDTSEHAEHGHPGRGRPRPAWEGAPAQIGAFALRAGDGATEPLARRADAAAGALALELPAGRWVVSLEAWDPGTRRAGRARTGLDVPRRPAEVPTLSDLLLVDGSLVDGATLAEAAPHALPRGWLLPGERAGLAWELFGFPAGESLTYRLTLERKRPGLLGRVMRGLRILRTTPARHLEWQEPGPAGPGPTLRSVGLDRTGLERGPWVVRLEIRRPGGGRLARERTLELR